MEAPSLLQKLFLSFFPVFLPCCKIGFHSTYSKYFVFFLPPNDKNNGLTVLLNPRCPPHDSSISYAHVGVFLQLGVVKSYEDNHAVIGVLTQPEEEGRKTSRKKNVFNKCSGTQI